MTTQPMFTGTWGKSPMAVQRGLHRAYLLLLAQFPKGQTRQPLNVSLVLDHSGSMGGEKIRATREAAKRVVGLLDPTDVVSVVEFDSWANIVVRAQPAADKRDICRKIDRIREAGGTAIAEGMEAGREELQKNVSPNRKSIMLLLTDGDTMNEPECLDEADKLAALGITCMPFGLGDVWNSKLLNAIAAKSGGSADHIADPRDVEPFFSSVVMTAANTVVKNAEIRLTVVKNVEIATVYRITPMMANLGYAPVSANTVSVGLGDIEGDVPYSIVVELNLQPRDAGAYRLAKAELLYTPVGAREPQVIELSCEITYVSNPAQEFVYSTVMNAVERVSAFKLQTRALKEAELGDIVSATQKLRGAATRLLNVGEVDAAAALNQQAAALNQQGVNGATLKQLEYGGTRRMDTRRLDLMGA